MSDTKISEQGAERNTSTKALQDRVECLTHIERVILEGYLTGIETGNTGVTRTLIALEVKQGNQDGVKPYYSLLKKWQRVVLEEAFAAHATKRKVAANLGINRRTLDDYIRFTGHQYPADGGNGE